MIFTATGQQRLAQIIGLHSNQEPQQQPTYHFDVVSFPEDVLSINEFGMASAPLDDSFADRGTVETLAFAAVAITALFCLEERNRRNFIERY